MLSYTVQSSWPSTHKSQTQLTTQSLGVCVCHTNEHNQPVCVVNRHTNPRVGQLLCEIVNGAIFCSMITYIRLEKRGQKSQAFLTQMVQIWGGNCVSLMLRFWELAGLPWLDWRVWQTRDCGCDLWDDIFLFILNILNSWFNNFIVIQLTIVVYISS